MYKYRKIWSLLFLFLFGAFWLHNALPHEHHSIDSAEHHHEVASTEHHHHHGDHSHGEEEPQENIDDIVLHFILCDHAHTPHSHFQLDQLVEANKRLVSSDISTSSDVVDTKKEPPGLVFDTSWGYYVSHSPFPESPHLSTHSLRGPPSIG